MLFATRTALLVAGCAFALPAQPSPADSLVALVGVSVVSMTSPAVTRNRTVLVRGGVIARIELTSRAAPPAPARVIDGRGKYLMPGFVDFHVHLGERADLGPYRASGVTSVVHIGGNGAQVIAWRDSVRAGQLAGPTIYAGFFVNGPLQRGGVVTATTTADAIDAVAQAWRRNFDFMKVYNSLTEEQYSAVDDEP